MTKFWSLPLLGIFVLLTFSSSQVFAHGEDKPGPNGGYIRMPGGFHTEVVKVSYQKFKVFLLDINWKSPTTQNSSVEATLSTKKGEKPISCEAKSNYYECALPKGSSLKTAQALVIKAKRENVIGGLATYDLPLKFFSHP